MNQNQQDQTAKQFTISHVFNVSREVVYDAWTTKEKLAQWWGAKGFTLDIKSFDFSIGGHFHYKMSLPDGMNMWGKFIYREVIEPELIAYVSSFSNEEGKVTRAPFSNSFPLEILNKVTFTEEGQQTRVTLNSGPVNTTDEEQKFFEGMFPALTQGFTGTFEQLEVFLKKEPASI
jgi:uncharacterized protein YndB with AHSA1/START domain